MLLQELNKFLQDEIETLLAPVADTAGLSNLVKEALQKNRPDPGVSTVAVRCWPLLPLIVCDTICGRYEQALPAAAGLEMLKAAAEVFDDIEDADNAESLAAKYGFPLAVNTASALLIGAERAFARLYTRGVDSKIIVSLMDKVNSYYLAACGGQHLDLSLLPAEAASEEMYLRVTGMKSAFAAECACYTGAALAGAEVELVQSMAEFGHNLGMAAQIANDIKGITGLRDIRQRKITLPVTYALAQTNGEIHRLLETTFLKTDIKVTSPPGLISDTLFDCGGILYASFKMEVYKQRALDILNALELKDIQVKPLRDFVA